MKKLLFLFFLTLSIANLNAQVTFKKNIPSGIDTLFQSTPFLMECADKSLLLSIYQIKLSKRTKARTLLMKLDSVGNVLKTKSCTIDENQYLAISIFEQTNYYLCFGEKHDTITDKHYFATFKIDKNLNKLEEIESVELKPEYNIGQCKVQRKNNKYWVSGGMFYQNLFAYSFCAKTDLLGHVLKYTEKFGFSDYFSDIICLDSTIITVGLTDLIVLDTSFNVKKIVPKKSPNIDETYDNYGSLLQVDSNRIILTGNRYVSFGKAQDIGISTYSAKLEPLGFNHIGDNDNIEDNPAWLQSLAQSKDKKSIYLGGISGLNNGPITLFSSNFVLCKFNPKNNTKLWTKYYGGDAYYEMYGLITTSDGGVIMHGFRYDYNKEHSIDVFLIKVTAEGNITATVAVPIESNKLLLYPNPGQEIVHLKQDTEEQQEGTLFMYNTLGQLVASFAINHANSDINTAPLAIGLYYYQYTSNSKKIKYQGTWIKQ
jgi:hypothetical protein